MIRKRKNEYVLITVQKVKHTVAKTKHGKATVLNDTILQKTKTDGKSVMDWFLRWCNACYRITSVFDK